ncbi:MAG: cation:proton antiporter [Saprospirales bacterium]|nr:cation:proton antiporter [Saprospirales bacterium]
MQELAGIIILGIIAQWLAWRTRVPSIAPLILIGLAVGPLAMLWTADGQKLIAPIYNPETGIGLFPQKYLFYFVSLSIGIILFEGGLTLKRKEIKEVGPVIGRLISLGSLVTFIGAGLGAHFIMDLNWSISFLFAALIIVTGPTVIAPILQNIPLNRNVSTVLKWEGILIDPIGALMAVLVYEFILSGEGGFEFTSHAVMQFVQIVLIGLALGTLAALFLRAMIKKELIPHFLLNVFTLALVLAVFVFSETLAHESGLLSVVVMGMVLGNLDVPRLKEILYFKESLSILLISILFILLAANIDLEDLTLLLDWRCLWLFLFVVFVLRPIGVMWSTNKTALLLREKLFISWVGPRGIVAAGIASLFGIRLAGQVPQAEYITPLVFMIVLGTVLLNASTARLMAKLLKVIQTASSGILLVGANRVSRVIAKYLISKGRHVVMIDSSDSNIEEAKSAGLTAFVANVYNDTLEEEFDLVDVGYLLAMTSSDDVNEYAMRRFQNTFGEKGSFRLITSTEMKRDIRNLPETGILSYTDDFINMSEVARDYPEIHEVNVFSNEHLGVLIKKLNDAVGAIPLFIELPGGNIEPLPRNLASLEVVEKGCRLVYIGKKIEE